MRGKLIFLACFLVLLIAGCAQTTHFGVPDEALTAPAEFEQTEAAIASAERSEGARYCPEKIAAANVLGKKAAEIYWACHTEEAMALLAKANKLAKEAESCQAPARVVTPPPPQPVPTPKPAPMPSIPPPPPSPPARQPISYHSGHFAFDKSDLTPETRAELDRVAEIMQNNPDAVLELQGHTDSVGSEEYNKALSDRRTEAVFDYLKSKGINPNRLKKMSLGEAKPVASNETDAGRAKNRRVDMVIIK